MSTLGYIEENLEQHTLLADLKKVFFPHRTLCNYQNYQQPNNKQYLLCQSLQRQVTIISSLSVSMSSEVNGCNLTFNVFIYFFL